MTQRISLAVDIDAPASKIFDAVSTTAGQRAFWTTDCDVSADRARFGFPEAPMDLEVDVLSKEPNLVQMTVTKGFPFWDGSTWEWEIGSAARASSGSGVLFRHSGFGEGYPELDLAHTAQTWALILDRLSRYVSSGKPTPFFP
jgi:hypothetical protein